MSAEKIAFCFPGQGSLEVGMGREIARAVPEAMDVFVRASEASGLDLVRLCFEAPEDELVKTEVQQPALVATSLAVLAALRSYGYRPDFVVGHSVGEFAALAAAEALGVEEAIALVRERGLAMAEAAQENPGSMAAILGLEDEVVEDLCARISASGRRTTTARARSSSQARTRRWTSAARRRSSRARGARSSCASRAPSTAR